MTSLLTDNLPLLAGAPNGIKKLRELILELAVRGKLVPQDPSDEPASELLKRIAKEKALSGNLKKTKFFAEITEDEQPFVAPSSWALSRLGYVGEWAVGSGFPTQEQGLTDQPIPFCKVSDMNLSGNERFILTANNSIDETTASRLRVNVHPAGTVVFPKIGGAIATNKRRLLVKPTAIDNNCLGLTPNGTLSSDYLYLLLSSIDLTRYQAGTSVPALSQGVLADIIVGVPPLTEQDRIIAKVDELMALCDRLEAQQADAESAHTQLVQALLDSLTQASDATDFAANWQRLTEHFHPLFTTEPSIDALKQTLLQLAVMGKLVPQAPTDEPANELLNRIQAEKNRLAAEGKLKKQKPLTEISEADTPFEIPNTWQWARLGEISHVFSGNAFKSEDFQEEPGVKVIKITNAGVGEFIKTDEYLPAQYENEYTSFRVFENDLILALTRPYISSGLKISRCPAEYDGALLNQRVASIRIFPDINNEFGFLFFKSPTVLAIYQERFGNSGLQPNLKMSDVTSLLIPIPPIEEQHRIAAKINQLTTLCDLIKIKIKESHHLVEDLSSALIAKGLA
ncbi:restriction endonuclease subunit S [Pseudomonas putida]|uniref:restriction endonuclease subunit S n=1 Tax=Pseudomonas putida TaxID=303 RepID=UPI002118414C|nr:restriction endonuclease subunit S [Pseudomonas putida]WNI07721.1 restriction endonuclease subunit S [Pseudomonas putida]